MRLTHIAVAVFSAAVELGAAGATSARAAGLSVSAPVVHDNLAVYFLRGPSSDGPVPLTLAEALAAGTAEVRETGSVNSLEIENTGTRDVFIQAGDIVKGGQQDRVLTMSMVLPAGSGKIPIASFCVEQGRWSRRGAEDARRFASAAEALPSREAKLAMKAPAAPPPSVGGAGAGRTVGTGAETSRRQQEMWAAVGTVQAKLASRLGASVAAPQSNSSLQLSLENERLAAARKGYVASLADKAAAPDIVGYVVVINGRITGADEYPSNALFRKMWPKQLAAAATEALGEAAKPHPGAAAPQTPSVSEVEAFLGAADAAPAVTSAAGPLASQKLQDGGKVLFVEALQPGGNWVHRSYVAK